MSCDSCSRRDFLQWASIAGLGLLAPLPLHAAMPGGLRSGGDPEIGSSDRTLILVTLLGGWDGWAACIPRAIGSDRQGQGLGWTSASVPLSDHTHLHADLAALAPIWEAGRLQVLLGTGGTSGSAAPTHTQQLAQWLAGGESDAGWLTGMPALRRGVPYQACLGAASIPVPDAMVLPSFALHAPDDVQRRRAGPTTAAARFAEHLQHTVRTVSDAPTGSRDGSMAWSTQIQRALRLIAEPVRPAVVTLSHTGFDTHVDQAARLPALFQSLATGLAELRRGLIAQGTWDSTLVAVGGDVGRSFELNALGGTDHASASVAMLMGGAVTGGLVNEQNWHPAGSCLTTTPWIPDVAQRWWNEPVSKRSLIGQLLRAS